MGKAKKKFIFFARQVWRTHFYFKSLRKERFEKIERIMLKRTRKRFIFNTSTTLPKIFVNLYVFCARYPNKYVNYFARAKLGYKIGEFYFTRKPYFFPQKDRKKKTKR